MHLLDELVVRVGVEIEVAVGHVEKALREEKRPEFPARKSERDRRRMNAKALSSAVASGTSGCQSPTPRHITNALGE
jgi:hypothetical protein